MDDGDVYIFGAPSSPLKDEAGIPSFWFGVYVLVNLACFVGVLIFSVYWLNKKRAVYMRKKEREDAALDVYHGVECRR